MKKIVFDYKYGLHPGIECKIVDEKEPNGLYSIPLYSKEEILDKLPIKDFNGYKINIKTDKPILIKVSADSFSGEYGYAEIATDYAIDEEKFTLFKDEELISVDFVEEKIYEELGDILGYEKENTDLDYDLDYLVDLVDTAMKKIKENAVECYVIAV